MFDFYVLKYHQNIFQKISKASLIVFEVTDTLEINIKHT